MAGTYTVKSAVEEFECPCGWVVYVGDKGYENDDENLYCSRACEKQQNPPA
jgi:hypothetical protein